MQEFRFDAWPTEYRFITQYFGARPWAYPGLPGHEGIDFQAPEGSKVFVVAAGKVEEIIPNDHFYGIFVKVSHIEGYHTIYAHLSQALVSEGQTLQAGDQIGLAGHTGNSEGAHLHLTLKKDGASFGGYPSNIIDPTSFVNALLGVPQPEPVHSGGNGVAVATAVANAIYIRDTVPDGTQMQAGQRFTETWYMQNTGNVAWTAQYSFVRVDGDGMGAPAEIPAPLLLSQGMAPISVEFTAPATVGDYSCVWRLRAPTGEYFGQPVWLKITVPAPVSAAVAPPLDFVRCEGMRFYVEDRPLRFVGVNLRGLAHYGRRHSDPLQYSQLSHRETQLASARDFGAKVIRLFLPDRDASVDEIEIRLRELLEIVKESFRDLYLIPVFTNLYKDVPFYVPSDDDFFYKPSGDSADLLSPQFFTDGYQRNYLPFVKQIVTAFRDEPNIFAWEIGNELKLDRADKGNPNDPNPAIFIHFNHEVAAFIKNLDPFHLVGTGMKSTQHAWLHTPELQESLYGSPHIDFVSIHSYEGQFDQVGDQAVWADAPLAAKLHKPFIVEEAGFDAQIFHDRPAKFRSHMQAWFDAGASGYMPWGFINDHAIGDGDDKVGIGVLQNDWPQLHDLLHEYANHLQLDSRGAEPALAGAGERGAAVARGLAGFDHMGYLQAYIAAKNAAAINDASAYDVTIATAQVDSGRPYWRVVAVRHLSPPENTGKRNIFVDALDEQGFRLVDPRLQVRWGWEGQTEQQSARPAALDKRGDEPATNIPMDSGQKVWLRMDGDLPSDTVVNLSTQHSDEAAPGGQLWNSLGHHSFYVIFQRAVREPAVIEPAVAPVNGAGTISTPIQQPAVSVPSSPVVSIPNTPAVPITTPIAASPVALALQNRLASKIGIDGNCPINLATGAIAAQVAKADIIAATGVGWVRLNFVLSQHWSSPQDQAKPQGHTWQESYRLMIQQFRESGMQIYGQIGPEAVHSAPDDQFREAPGANPLQNSWVQEYARNFASIAAMFSDGIQLFESFNEPDNYNGKPSNWIHPGWFATMLEAIYQALDAQHLLDKVILVSGPLQGLQGPKVGNGAPDYLKRTYEAGIQQFGWGQNGKAFPFAGVGYHLYVHEAYNGDLQNQQQLISNTYKRYLEEMRTVMRNYEGREKPLYISEMGWFSNDQGQGQQAMEHFQAESVRHGLALLARDPGIPLVVLFCTQDFDPPQNNKFYGVYHQESLSESNRKPLFDAVKAVCAQQLQAMPEMVAATAVVRQDSALHLADRDTIQPRTLVYTGQRFAQSWTVRNSGNSAWGAGYRLVWIGGEHFQTPFESPVGAAAPGAETVVSLTLTAPSVPGLVKGMWQLCNERNELFGEPLNVEIYAVAQAPVATTAANVVGRGAQGVSGDAVDRLAIPAAPAYVNNATLAESDPELYSAWRRYMEKGLSNNQMLFEQILKGFMQPYWATVWLQGILFTLGVLSFMAAVWIGAATGQTAFAAIFGGLSVASVVAYFFTRPLQSLEQNLQVITWLGIIYNTYWTKLLYIDNQADVQAALEVTTQETIARLDELMKKHQELQGKRLTL